MRRSAPPRTPSNARLMTWKQSARRAARRTPSKSCISLTATLPTRSEVALAPPRDPAGDTAAFQAIEREAERMGEIVADLLTLARADSGELPVGRQSLYLDDVAAQAVEAARTLAERRGVKIGRAHV